MNPAKQYIINRQEPYRSIMIYLAQTIESKLPDLQLLYKWHLPFYYIDGKIPFCYLNNTKDYVDLVFWHSTHMKDNLSYMTQDGRKHFKSLRYKSLDSFEHKILVEVLLECYSHRDKAYYK